MRLPADLLSRSVEEASRLVALSLMEETGMAAGRLADRGDTEALHDFRVGLRRLRSCLKAYRSQLQASLPKKARRRLKQLTSATNPQRDREVQLAWLRAQATRLPPEDTPGLAWMIGRLVGRASEQPEAIDKVAGRFRKTAGKLRPELRTFQAEVRAGGEQRPLSFGRVTGELLRELSGRLRESIIAVAGPSDAERAHAARITAKRMRYLLEPLMRRAPGVKTAVKSLKGLQDVLGELHDMQVITGDVASALSDLGPFPGQEPPLGPGLAAVGRLAQEQAERCFAEFDRSWRGERGDAFFRRAEALSTYLLEGQDRIKPPAQEPAPRRSDWAAPEHKIGSGSSA